MAPLVSVIIPCFNYGRFLSQALDSLVSQTWQNWECIVVDDGSLDNTRDIVTSFQARDPRIKYLYQPNQGVSAARNAGLKACRGAYIQLLDADDLLEEQKLEQHVKFLEQHSEVSVVYGPADFFWDENCEMYAGFARQFRDMGTSGSGDDMLLYLVRANIMVVNAAMLRKSAVEDLGGFDQTLRCLEDWEYWLRCALAGKNFQYLNAPNARALVRVHESSMTQDVMPMLMTNLTIRERLRALPLIAKLQRENDYRIGIQFAKIAKVHLQKRALRLAFRNAVFSIVRSRLHGTAFLFLVVHLLPSPLSADLKSIARRLRVVS